MNNNRNAKGAAEGRPSILLHFVGVAVCFASDLVLWSFPVSAPRIIAVADAVAGPMSDADGS